MSENLFEYMIFVSHERFLCQGTFHVPTWNEVITFYLCLQKKLEMFFSQKPEGRQHVTEKRWLASHSAALPTHVTLASHLTAAHQGR